MQHFKCAAASAFTATREIGFRLISKIVHQRVRDRTDETHVDSETEATSLDTLASFPSNEGGLAQPLKSLSSSASRGFVIVGILSRLHESAVPMNWLRSNV